MKALDTWTSVVAAVSPGRIGPVDLVECAAVIEDYIWKGSDAVQDRVDDAG